MFYFAPFKPEQMYKQLSNQFKKNKLKMEDNQKEKKPTEYINVFGDWVKSIPVGDYNRIRHQVISECKITNQIFKHWKCGNSKVPVLAHEKINQIAGRLIFEEDGNQ